MHRLTLSLSLSLSVVLAACNTVTPRPAPARPGPAAAVVPTATPVAVPTPVATPASPVAPAAPAEVSDAERLAAGQAVQQLLAARQGPLSITSIQLISGVFRVVAQPVQAGAQPIETYITRDLQLIFPTVARRQAPQAPAAPAALAGDDGAYGACLQSKHVRLFGDPNQPQTQRQLAELGSGGRQLLVDCAARPGDCAVLGQTTLPILQLGEQKVASLVPRAVIAKWAGCGAPAAAPAAP